MQVNTVLFSTLASLMVLTALCLKMAESSFLNVPSPDPFNFGTN
jgi:hypothetical protein